MSRILTAKEICERALRAVGAFPVTQSAADTEHLREAMFWLDLNLAQLSGSTRIFWLVPDTVLQELENGVQSYALNTTLGADLPLDGIQFPVEAWLQDDAGNRGPLEIVQRHKFEDVCRPAEVGVPKFIYIDRLVSPTMQVYPTLDADETAVYTVHLVVQRFSPNVSPGGVTGQQPQSGVLTGVRQAWQRWLILQLSHDIGSGPVYTLPESRLRRFKSEADSALSDLLAFENREHASTPPVCEPWGM